MNSTQIIYVRRILRQKNEYNFIYKIPVYLCIFQGAGGPIVIQQPQQAQILQTPDGQTFIYHPVQLDNQAVQQQQPTCKYCSISTNFVFMIKIKI